MKRLTDKQVQKLAYALDDAARFAEDYRREESSCEAEYAETFGYGDGEINYSSCDDHVQNMLSYLEKKLKPKSFRRVLERCCVLSLESYYCISNEVFAMHIGEVEEQVDDLGLCDLSAEDRERVRQACSNCYLGTSDCIFVNMDGERWVMSVDPDKLEPIWQAIRNQFRREPPMPQRLETKAERARVFRLIHGGAA